MSKSCVGASVCDSWNSELGTEEGCSKGRALSSLEVEKFPVLIELEVQ